MDGPRGYYVKWNKSEKDRHHTIHLHVQSKEQDKQMKQKGLIDAENKKMVAREEEG